MSDRALEELSSALAQADAARARINAEVLTKLPSPLSIEAGDCVAIKGVSFREAPDDLARDAGWSILAAATTADPACDAEPIGWAEFERGDEHVIEVYWPKAA